MKDDFDLTTVKISDKQQLMLMGTAEVVAVPVAGSNFLSILKIPALTISLSLINNVAVTFFEDMTEAEKAEKGVVLSAGLHNLGNTCYLNSTVQCLRYMPELREALTPIGEHNPSATISCRFRETAAQLDSTTQPLLPMRFVAAIRTTYPQFAQQNQGRYMQQDAEEFYTSLTTALSEGMSSVGANLDSFLGVQIEESMTCDETDAEPPVQLRSRALKLVCNIQGGPLSTPVDFLQQGLKLALEGSVEKHSDILGRNAIWRKRQKVASVPKYLCIHFMRFFWKESSRDQGGEKVKILRSVAYPDALDIYEFCTPELQAKLRHNRDLEEKRIEAKLGSSGKVGGGVAASASATSTIAVDASVSSMEVEAEDDIDEADREALRAALAMSVGGSGPEVDATAAPAVGGWGVDIGNGLPPNFNGLYELHSIVTHKGRTADSGHYIGWARQAPGSAFWWKFDDDTVHEVGTEEIMLLKGGGDRDMAYLAFYRFREPSE